MKLDASAWSNPGERSTRLYCPGCGAGLPFEAMAAGQRLARCRQCGKLVRKIDRRAWPATIYDKLTGDQNYSGQPDDEEIRLEIAPNYPYPALPCAYCEHINHDHPPVRSNGQQFCANCGADLKKFCLNCDAPIFVLDYYCTHCRSDQEKVKYAVEAMYWQHYNEGKRLAGLGRWEDAERELSVFFNPSPDLDREHIRRARQIYISSIAPYDAGQGLQLYNESIERLRLAEEARERQLQRRQMQRWAWRGGAVVGLAVISWLVFGSWWTIFVIVPGLLLLIAVLVFLLLSHLGLS